VHGYWLSYSLPEMRVLFVVVIVVGYQLVVRIIFDVVLDERSKVFTDCSEIT